MNNLLNGMTLTVIMPVYNEADAIEMNLERTREVLINDGIEASYLLIDDGSKDDTWLALERLVNAYPEVSVIGFARNFGKELALSAGLDTARSDLYLFMDSDLQHPPRYIKTLLQEMRESKADIVEGVKSSRGKESLKYKLVAKTFYKILNKMTGLEMDNSSDFKLMTNEVAESIREFHERNVFFRGIVQWVGFKKVQIEFEVDERNVGNSSFSTFKLIQLALNAVFSYTSKPLFLTIGGGIVFFIFALLLGIQTLYNYATGSAVSGFSTVILLQLLIGSWLMFSLGIIGVYVSRVYDEVKARPRYLIQKSVNSADTSEDV